MGCGAASAGHQSDADQALIAPAADVHTATSWAELGPPALQRYDPPASSGLVSLGGQWYYESSADAWEALSPEISAQLLVAWHCGETHLVYCTEDATFEVDFGGCVQTNQDTGCQQQLGWVANDLETSATDDESAWYGYGSEDMAPDTECREEEVAEGTWVEYGDDDMQRLLAAWASGCNLVYYSSHGYDFEVDFTKMLQTNLTTGDQQWVGVEMVDDSGEIGGETPQPESLREDQLEEWFEYSDPDTGKPYYFNGDTTTWEKPTGDRVRVRVVDVYAGGESSMSQTVPPSPAQRIKATQQADGPEAQRPTGFADPTLQPGGQTAAQQESCADRPAYFQASPSPAQEDQPQFQRSGWQQGEQTSATQSRTVDPTVAQPKAQATKTAKAGKKYSLGPERKQGPGHEAPRIPAAKQPSPDWSAYGQAPQASTYQQASPFPPSAEAYQEWYGPAPSVGAEVPASSVPCAGSQPSARIPAHGAASPTAGRPRVRKFKAAGASSRPARRDKKWTLGPEKRQAPKPPGPQSQPSRPPRVDAAPPQPEPTKHAQASGERVAPPQKALELPIGAEWPREAKARNIAETLFKDMDSSRKAPLKERQKAYRALCLSWHPDKNPKHQELATEVFKFLQVLKQWYFE